MNDFILNQKGHGEVAEMFADSHFDTGYFRPWLGSDGRTPMITINTGRTKVGSDGQLAPVYRTIKMADLARYNIDAPVGNASTLRKEQYIRYDTAAVLAARQRLKAWSDLESANSYGGFDGMANLTLEYEAMSDPGEALVDIDGLSEGRQDQPLFKLRSMPLPIIHSDFWVSERRLAVSRKSGQPLDTSMAEACGRRIAEKLEQITIGVAAGIKYGTVSTGPTAHDGNSQIYGYTNYPQRVIKADFTVPTGSNPEVTMREVLSALSDLQDVNHYGPFMLYYSPDWMEFMAGDYARLGGNNATETLRDRILRTPAIRGCEQLDFLTDTFTLIFVEMVSEVARAINGLELTTVAWPSQGGMRKNFKVMCIKAPQLRHDYNGNTGILHGTTA